MIKIDIIILHNVNYRTLLLNAYFHCEYEIYNENNQHKIINPLLSRLDGFESITDFSIF